MKDSSKAHIVSLLDKSLVKTFPKVEVHRHLEGMFSLKHLFELSKKNDLDISKQFEDFKKEVQFPKDSGPDFLLFLSKFKRFWYRSFEDIDYLVYNSVLTLVEEGLIYLELRFAPEHFAEFNDFDRNEVIKTVINASNRAAREINIPLKYILTYNRMFQTAEEMIRQQKEIEKLQIPDIVGIDLAGDEINYAPELYSPFFDYIQSLGKYKIDIHAGEVTESSQIWNAINLLHADRIGHGISAIKDNKLLEYLKENQIYLCQCITSNFQTGAWTDSPNHPLNELYKRGYPVCINSDDPSIQDADLTDDYIKCIKYFDFTAQDLYNLNINAINASFASNDEKEKLKIELKQKYENFLLKLK